MILTSIAKGKGTAYLTTLEKLGVSTTDTSGKTKSATEVYHDVVTITGTVVDKTKRASLAVTKPWWDMVDDLDVTIGGIALRFPDVDETLLAWSTDVNFGLSRIATAKAVRNKSGI